MFFSKISRSFTKLFFTFSSDIVAQLIFRFDFCSGHGKQILPFVIDALQKKKEKKKEEEIRIKAAKPTTALRTVTKKYQHLSKTDPE